MKEGTEGWKIGVIIVKYLEVHMVWRVGGWVQLHEIKLKVDVKINSQPCLAKILVKKYNLFLGWTTSLKLYIVIMVYGIKSIKYNDGCCYNMTSL